MSVKDDAFRRELANYPSREPDTLGPKILLITSMAGSVGCGVNRDPASSLRAMTSLRTMLDDLEPILVARARAKGSSWGQIAAALGKTRQSTHSTYVRNAS